MATARTTGRGDLAVKPIIDSTVTSAPATFTAARIAAALGVKRQSVQWQLRDTAPSTKLMIAGQETCAWDFAALPDVLKARLATEAARRGVRTAEQLLAERVKEWEPPIPLAQIAQHCLDKAAKLQRAMAPSLTRQNDLTISAAEFERLGVADYCQVFGYEVSMRHWRDLFKRTVDRDAGAENWARLGIYLDDSLAHKPECRPLPFAEINLDFRDISQVLAAFRSPTHPTEREERYLWLRAFERFEAEIEAGRSPRSAKYALLAFLFKHAPFLADSLNALRVSFDRKYDRWVKQDRRPDALKDGRKTEARKGQALSEDQRDYLVWHAVNNCGGRVSQAWRETQGAGATNSKSKSYVPRNVREDVRNEVRLLDDIHHGPRQHKLNGAYLSRDWSAVASGDWYQADDVTFPVYYYEPDGQGWYRLMRGQVILFIDLRSTKVLGFSLISERNYNANVIRATITRICEEHGLPRKGFYFERGIWFNSKILKGDAAADLDSWNETELGLREFGLRFVHSNLPKSKPVERVLGALQNRMEGVRGYVGRNEMVEKLERVQRAKLGVEGRKVEPAEYFLSVEEWISALESICDAYNAEKQDGKMTCGLSPDEAFQKFDDATNPPIRMDATCRYLLAHHKRPVKVTSNGITLRFGQQVFNYRGAETGPLVGQTVLAWFNPETPEILAVTDLDRRNPFTVARAHDVPAMEAPEDLLKQEMSRLAGHQAFAKVRYRTLKAKFARPFRRNLVDAQTSELGREIEQQKAAVESGVKREQATLAKARKISRELGMPVPPRLRPETLSALEELKEMMADESQESSAAADTKHP